MDTFLNAHSIFPFYMEACEGQLVFMLAILGTLKTGKVSNRKERGPGEKFKLQKYSAPHSGDNRMTIFAQ